jgi:hypothetical protein
METLRVLCEVPTETLYIMYWYNYLDFKSLNSAIFEVFLPLLQGTRPSVKWNTIIVKRNIIWTEVFM